MPVHTPPYVTALSAHVAQLEDTPWRTRFAPAPTGLLHLGHLVNAIFVWGLARAFGGVVLLRIEDHDRRRCRAAFERALLDDLDWLGLVPDVGALRSGDAASTVTSVGDDRPSRGQLRTTGVFRQSDYGPSYEAALSRLSVAGRVYVCRCTRRDIARQAADRFGEETPYPGTCRSLHLANDASPARRVILDDVAESFDDLRLGAQQQWPHAQCGDLLARDRHGQWSYQFAVAVDDFNQQIDVVIRGEDLLASTGRQLQVARLLGRTTPLRFLHHPLLYRTDGLKLSKSQGDTGIGELRAQGYTAGALLGLAAHRAGLTDSVAPISARDLHQLFV